MSTLATRTGESRFEFATATRIRFGAGTLDEVGPQARPLGSRAFVVTGRAMERAGRLFDLLAKQRIEHVGFPIAGEPTIANVTSGVARARAERCDFVIGFGGGSAIDAAKAIAALLTNRGDLFEYLEVIGQGRPLVESPVPWIAIPTTAGTGAEVTRNAVLASPAHRVKVSLRSPLLFSRLAVVDPDLTRGLPRAIRAATGLDALTQLIEPYVSVRANPVTDLWCRDGILRAARSLRAVCESDESADGREDMALASLFGGLALANAGLGAVHGFAAPIGGMFSAPHGAVCAALLPHVMDVNLHALRARAPGGETIRRFGELARLVTGNENAAAEDGITWVRDLCATLRIPRLRDFGVTEKEWPALIENASLSSSMKGNPIVLERDELRTILARAS